MREKTKVKLIWKWDTEETEIRRHLKLKEKNENTFRKKSKQSLKESGFIEIYNSHFKLKLKLDI